MNRRRPRKASEVGSFADLRTYYDQAIAELDECHRQRRAIEGVSKANRKDLLASRSEAKSAKRELTVTLTKAQKIKDENASSAKYAAAAGTVMVIVYEFVKVTPHGWGRYDDFANHEIVYSTAQVLLGIAMAWALRPLRH
jgi:hypothetical protein